MEPHQGAALGYRVLLWLMRQTPFLLHAPLTSAPSRVASFDRGPCRRQLMKALSVVELDHGAVVPQQKQRGQDWPGRTPRPDIAPEAPHAEAMNWWHSRPWHCWWPSGKR